MEGEGVRGGKRREGTGGRGREKDSEYTVLLLLLRELLACLANNTLLYHRPISLPGELAHLAHAAVRAARQGGRSPELVLVAVQARVEVGEAVHGLAGGAVPGRRH